MTHYPYNLPIRLPIADGMQVGTRDEAELEWLLDYGTFVSRPYGSYRRIVKMSDREYVMYQGSHERFEKLQGEEVVYGAGSLHTLLTVKQFGAQALSSWEWEASSQELQDALKGV